MSWKKKKLTKKEKKRNRIILLVLLVVLIIVLFSLMLFEIFVGKKDYYSIESRISNVALSQQSNSNSNYRTIGWLKVQGTNLDLPILAGIDDNTNFPVEMEKYVWNVGSNAEFQNKIDIMGHNIFNLSSSPKTEGNNFNRFEELMGFVYYDYAKDNKYIQLTIDGKDYLYKIFSVDFIDAIDVDMFPSGEYTKEDLKYQIGLFKDNTLYDYDVDVNENDQLISLITCTRFFGSDQYIDFLVNGRLVREGEKVSNYSMKKNEKNYKKVEKILKGDDDNESDSSM